MLMFTCMDSRMLPTRFLQSHVGEVFVVRNGGNLIPKSSSYGNAGGDVCISTEPAAMELAVKRGNIRHILICGHSDCKAMNTLYGIYKNPETFNHASPMDAWVRANGHSSIQKLEQCLKNRTKPLKFQCDVNTDFSFEALIDPSDKLAVEDKLSQVCINLKVKIFKKVSICMLFYSDMILDKCTSTSNQCIISSCFTPLHG